MGCNDCVPVVINTGGGGTTVINGGTDITITGTGTPGDPYVVNYTGVGGGAVDSVTGAGVVSVTPTTGDSVVSIIPGTTPGAVLVTNPGETAAEWGPHLSTGTIQLTFTEQANAEPGTITVSKWFRIGDLVTVDGLLTVDVSDTTQDGELLIGNLPFPTAAFSGNRVSGVFTSGSSNPTPLVGRINNNNLSTTDVLLRLNGGAGIATPGAFSFSYIAVPL